MSQKNNLTIAQKIAKLDELVAWFDSDDFELEKSIEKFKEAEQLAKQIEHDLNELKNSVEVIDKSFDRE